MKKIRLLIIEDNRLLREGLTIMLKKQNDIDVVAAVGDGENIAMIMRKHKPELLLLDMGLRHRSSLNLVKLIRKNTPEIKIIIMDLIPIQDDILEFVRAGVFGFLLKDATVNDFQNTIRSVAQGFQVLPPDLTGSLFSQIIEHALNEHKSYSYNESVRMTKRERQVIELISQGYTNKEIAGKLHISAYTVKSHVHNILEKLTLRTRVQIAKYLHDSKKTNSSPEDISLLED